MKARLDIFEKTASEQTSLKPRSLEIDVESLTIGTSDHADLRLIRYQEDFLLEIKRIQNDQFWLVNMLRTPGLKLNGKTVTAEARLQAHDQISVGPHRLQFQFEKKKNKVDEPNFQFSPANDEALWKHLLSEKEFDEILINGPQNIFVDFRGNLFKAPWNFSSAEFLLKAIAEIDPKISGQIENGGWISTRLHRTLRLQIALPPLVETPHLAIRKARQNPLTLEQLEAQGFGSDAEINYLRQALGNRESILISGGTSTGKTVLLRSLLEKIPASERLVVLEEEAEVDWPHPHTVTIETGRGNLRGALIESLRMRPSRLIISEVRGPEAFDMLQAMNTGHEGSMTTLHSNSPREALSRLESLVMTANMGISISAARRHIAHAIKLIVQLERDEFGKRRIQKLVRVGGLQNDVFLLSEPVGLEPVGLKQRR